MELKLRGLPVSGTKTDLIERLKTYQDLNNNGVATSTSVTVTTSSGATGNTGEVTVAFPVATVNKPVANTISSFPPEKTSTAPGSKAVNTENVSSPLPISPSPSEQSSLSTDDTSMADTFPEMTMMSPSQFLSTSPLRASTNEDNQNRNSGSISTMEFDVAEKDRKLVHVTGPIEKCSSHPEACTCTRDWQLAAIAASKFLEMSVGHFLQSSPLFRSVVMKTTVPSRVCSLL